MKNNIIKYALISAALLSYVLAFGQQDPASEKARKNEVKAQTKLRLARKDSAADFQKFKTQAEAKIKDNKEQIALLKKKKLTGTPAANKKYDKDVLVLETRNNDLAKRIRDANDTPTSGWGKFKLSFNNSMDDLGCAMKDVGSCER